MPREASRSPRNATFMRPGLLVYSSYHSDRHPMPNSALYQAPIAAKPKVELPKMMKFFAVGLALVVIVFLLHGRSDSSNTQVTVKTGAATNGAAGASSIKQPVTSAAVASKKNYCANNTDAKAVIVSIGQRHLWACSKNKQVYDSAVITGMQGQADTLTPVGTYHVYTKEAHVTLKGTDSTGAWSDPVDYWMPFLENQYGTYGFHDANWRAPNDFGNIDPNSNKGSHGCIEVPTATSAWLYNWIEVGTTTISIEA